MLVVVASGNVVVAVTAGFQTEEASHELDWSREDRRHLDNFIVARCVRRFVLEEAFEWTPDPVADALAKINAKMGMETPPDGAAPAATVDAADDDGGVGGGDDDASIESAGADGDAAAAAAAAEGSVDKDSQGEGWVAGRALQKFKGDWMALARKRTGRPAAAGAARRQGGRHRRDGRDGAAAPGLEANVRSRR